MLISCNWINDYVDIADLDPQAVADRITMSSAEVEGLEHYGRDLDGIVVGRIVERQPHPQSDKLSLVTVDTGTEKVASVCGAPNAREGLLTPFCPVGGRVIGIGKVEARKVAGSPSNGMCLSPLECGLGESHETIVELDERYQPGDDFIALAGVRDTVIEIDNKSLTHRPDLWGHYGFAREIAALLGRPLRPLPLLKPDDLRGQSNRTIDVQVEDPAGCPRYSCLLLENIQPGTAPLWMQTRLFHCGLRAISLTVDLTNYVLLDLGQPMHAFDADIVDSIRVASTTEPITFTTLDDMERTIPAGVVLIYHEQTPIALAGIMGGGNSEVSESTSRILLESANFDAYRIRRATVEIGHRTDSSARFEKSLDPALTLQGLGRFTYLLKEEQPAARIGSDLADVDVTDKQTPTVTVTKSEIERKIGVAFTADRIAEILNGLSLQTTHDGEVFTVQVPGFRATKDISMAADIVEEVARVHGFDNVPAQPPQVQLNRYVCNPHRQLERKAKRLLAQRFGLVEAHTYAWFDDNWLQQLGEPAGAAQVDGNDVVRLANSPTPEMARLRTTLAPNLLAVVEKNQQWRSRLGFFELGSRFIARGSDCDEAKTLGIVLADREARQGHDGLFFDMKGVVEWLVQQLRQTDADCVPFADSETPPRWAHPAKGCWIDVQGTRVGWFALAEPSLLRPLARDTRLALLELNFDRLVETTAADVRITPIPRYPLVDLDFSLLMDETTRYRQVQQALDSFESPLLRSSRLIDVYRGDKIAAGHKSMTFRVIIGSDERTLKGKEIETFSQNMVTYLENQGFQVRAA